MSDEYDFDYSRAHELLSIVNLVAEVAPTFSAIASEAMAELKEINQDLLDAIKARKAAAEASDRSKLEAQFLEGKNVPDEGEDTLGETTEGEPKPVIRRTL